MQKARAHSKQQKAAGMPNTLTDSANAKQPVATHQPKADPGSKPGKPANRYQTRNSQP